MYRRRARRKRHKSVADWSVEKSARGGSRTHMRKNPRRILSPQRLPFRHPGAGRSNLANRVTHCNRGLAAVTAASCSHPGTRVVSPIIRNELRAAALGRAVLRHRELTDSWRVGDFSEKRLPRGDRRENVLGKNSPGVECARVEESRRRFLSGERLKAASRRDDELASEILRWRLAGHGLLATDGHWLPRRGRAAFGPRARLRRGRHLRIR